MKRRLIFTLAIALMLIATLSLPAMAADSADVTASVTVTSVISITISGAAAAGIDFGSQIPGATNVLETHSDNVTPSITVTVNGGTTVNVDLQINGTDFGTGFTIDNAKYSTSWAGAKTPLSTSYSDFATDVAPGGSVDLWHWLDVPSSGVTATDYSSDFSYKAVAHVP